MQTDPLSPGIYLVHKPVGPTSFSIVQTCIDAARAAAPGRKPRICHGGTLDPFAHGLLLLLVGEATRLFDHLHDIPKEYLATVRWGIETDNGDPHGKPIFVGDPAALSPGRLDETLRCFVGWQEQVPPATSNKRIAGERAYLKAHRGETVILPPSRVYLHEAEWLAHDLPRESRLRIVVRGGYFVRALVRDLGRALGCGAHLATLQRTAIGPWHDPGPGNHLALHGHDLLPWARKRLLTDQEVGALRQGRSIPTGALEPGGWALPPGFPDPQAPVRGVHQSRLTFLLRADDSALRAATAFRPGL